MKYVIDLDAFVECLDCVDSIKVNNNYYISIPLLKEFIDRFPKDEIHLVEYYSRQTEIDDE